MLLPSKSDFHGPGFAAAGWMKTVVSRRAIVQVMRVDISRRERHRPVSARTGSTRDARTAGTSVEMAAAMSTPAAASASAADSKPAG
jgi:hypothetical protein